MYYVIFEIDAHVLAVSVTKDVCYSELIFFLCVMHLGIIYFYLVKMCSKQAFS